MSILSRIEYRLSTTRGTLAPPAPRGAVIRRAWNVALRRGNAWHVFTRTASGRDGEDSGRDDGPADRGPLLVERGRARRRFKRLVKNAKPGEVVVIDPRTPEGEDPLEAVAVRPVLVRLRVTDTDGNHFIDRIFTATVLEFGNAIHSLGMCARRLIAGTSSWTQHCPWPPPDPGPNAWDIGASFAVLSDLADYYERHGEELGIGLFIFNRRSWRPGRGYAPYSGVDPHTGHIHVEGAVTRTGSPQASC